MKNCPKCGKRIGRVEYDKVFDEKVWIAEIGKSFNFGADMDDEYENDLEVIAWVAPNGKTYFAFTDNMNGDIFAVKETQLQVEDITGKDVKDYLSEVVGPLNLVSLGKYGKKLVATKKPKITNFTGDISGYTTGNYSALATPAEKIKEERRFLKEMRANPEKYKDMFDEE